MKKNITLILILLSFLQIQSQTIISGGNVYGDWIAVNSPYLIQGDIVVQHGDRLAIAPGVEIIFQGSYAFEIQGRISAIGTPTDKITFTTADTTGFNSGMMNGWSGLTFSGINYPPTENSYLEYCQIQYSSQNGICCIDYPTLVVENTSIVNNTGYGITLFDYSDITINTISIQGNKAGGIQAFYSAPSINDFSIFDNQGCGIKLTGNSTSGMLASISNGFIYSNSTIENGGGIALYDGVQVIADKLTIRTNSAENGGGIYCDNAECDFTNSSIVENSAKLGGGICVMNLGNVNLSKVLVASNFASQEGGASYCFDSEINLTKSTVSDNATGGLCGGLYFDLAMGEQNTITNSIVWNNFPDEIYATEIQPVVSYSDIKDGFDGLANIDEDPLFEDSSDADYHLQWQSYPVKNDTQSPCIDAGNPESEPDPDGTVADMGAYFYDQSLYTYVPHTTQTDKVTIYPNPVQNELRISGVAIGTRIMITSMSGAVVFNTYSEGSNLNFPVSGLVKGVYLMHIGSADGTSIVKKFIKQ